MENELKEFIKNYEEKVVPLSKETNLAYFEATVSGNETKYTKASELQIELNKIYSDKKAFEKLKSFRNSDEIKDPLLKRQLAIIYNMFAGEQFDEKLQEKIIRLSTKIEKEFSTFRAKVNGKNLTDNQIDETLENSTDNIELEEVWNASKQIGRVVEKDVIALVKMRNESASYLGYSNYHEMSLSLGEQSAEELDKLFDDLDELTRNEFIKIKNEIDEVLSAKYKVRKKDLMPWHFQDKFFQQGPKIYSTDLDKYFKNQNIADITKSYYSSIGLNIQDILSKSDLYEREGKYQHAYCTQIDREGDIRVVCNIKPNYKWMGTMLHEFGHAVYDKFVSDKLPWQLREHAHIFTTEAIAMLFGRFASNPQWLRDVIGIPEDEKKSIAEDCFKSLKLEQLVFSRWVQVMYRFERGMYSNPDQDLNSLWWNLVEKYQLLKKPGNRNEPDWAAKIHVALYPAYYHNYMLGELLASQLYYYITEKVLKEDPKKEQSFAGEKAVGEYLKYLFFSYGALYHWNQLIKRSTGEELTPKYYARQFVNHK